ncbi:WD repeat-containing protein 7 isoform X2 [Strongylocentrotus purpuratus]|uniref:WD repeat-containing protein 7 n=1 Tax=Strongylocentrotus purpuratus TaxID=7668 RepID=A0A7M7MYZ3_STRPU|nr:WD repeat-containing protein 7 isoform X2 [Strongylocentrotus purpuratus]|eukprot:XP_011681298.1 PREDICTED: WD repeat-containing protein 7 isoform X2 [Strongylocentrotus purpuratus]
MTSSGLVVPIVLWGKTAPTHCISAILVTSDQQTIITGCHDGQVILWDLNDNMKVVPRNMLFGHSSSITCLARANENWESANFVSAAENGEIFLWDVSDGRCIEQTKVPGVHLTMHPYQVTQGSSREWRIICQGYYPDIHVLDAGSLELLYTLSSKVAPDWISALCVTRPLKRQEDVVIGISTSGMLKVWNLTGNDKDSEPKNEEECKQLRCRNARSLAVCAFTLRTVLVVCSKQWQICDAGDFSQLCVQYCEKGQHWSGGDFIAADRVLVWSNQGKGYLYQLPSNCIPESDDFRSNIGQNQNIPSAKPFLYCILEAPMHKNIHSSTQPLSCSPAMTFFYGRRGPFYKLFACGDSSGRVTVWKVPEVSDKELSYLKQEEFDTLPVMPPTASNSLKSTWESCSPKPSGIIDQLNVSSDGTQEKQLVVTSSVYIPSQGWIVCGRQDGSIAIVPAVQTAIAQLLEGPHTARRGWPPHRILRGHQGKVTCLMYPHQENSRYDPSYLVSGGVDFTITLWDIFAGSMMHTFCVHGGELTRIVIPPASCNARVLTCVCTVASDHSVALLSLRDRKCMLLASRHLFPIRHIKWRPAEDFLIVGLEDNSVFVWQMETGHLDRVAEGSTAEDMLEACDAVGETTEMMLTPAQSIAQAFRRRSLTAIRNAAHRTLLAAAQGSMLNVASGGDIADKDPNHALTIQAIKSNVKDPDFHVLFFDAENLIVQLLTDKNLIPGIINKGAQGELAKMAAHAAKAGSGQSPKLSQKFVGFISEQIKKQIGDSDSDSDELGPLRPPRASQSKGGAKRRGPKHLTLDSNHLTLDIAQLFMSCLHAWGLDPSLDEICKDKLGLLKPFCPVSFGLLSHGAHMSLMLPGWHHLMAQEVTPAHSPDPSTMSAKEALELKKRSQQELQSIANEAPKPGYLGHWELSRAVTTQHLLSVISVANTLMGMNNASFVMLSHLRKAKPKRSSSKGKDSTDNGTDDLADLTPEQAQIKQGWSLLAALHCVLLPDLLGSVHYKPPYLEMLARRWQDRCLEVRAASQALLLAELQRIGTDGREEVINQWAPHLPHYVDSSVSLTAPVQSGQSPLAGGGVVRDGHFDTGSSDSSEMENEEEILSGDSPIRKVSSSFESRRKQATAIVMLGVIGAQFGAEIQPSRQRAPSNTSNRPIQQGFGLSDYSLARHTAQALAFLLLQPPSVKLPAHTPIRRAGIDLMGRGFTVWEPFIDVSAVLLGLLELCCDPTLYSACIYSGLPITPAADSCRSAHHALSLIATARPATFITTMAKEVARHQALASNAQVPASVLNTSPLQKAKAEILRIVELLIEKMQNDVSDLLVEVVDIVVFSLDTNQVKSKGLMEVFPSICRFNMLSYCHSSKRLAVGAKTGAITMHDLKSGKTQVLSGHQTAVTALSFSTDGKHLASYSFGDTKLCFWQSGASLLGGMISSSTKCVKCYMTKPFNCTSTANQLRQVSVTWPHSKAIILRYLDGTMDKFSL